ncbi:hypothetical protein DFH11DRAFT_59568 [Phellopilus nigrolimitatus]|nr:hypothetical protein DFH11DRAFT_59568 [Phellopilus nigrolimitatus]
MQRQLHISLRLLCRHQCRRRLYSSHSAALQQHRPLDTSYDETVASSASHLDDHTDDPTSSETSHSRPDEAGVSINKKDKKLRSGADEKDSDKRRSGPNKVDTYLASLRAGGIEPTLNDLLQLNPRKRPSSDSPRYAAAYTELLHRLCRTFSRTQLRRFVQELKLDSAWASAKQRKEDYAKFIMEQHWGWDSLKEVEIRKSDKSEILVKSFHMSAKELFLLLGRDGSELLQISIDYNVHMSVSPNPLSIQIEGSKGSLRRLEALIAERKKAIIEEIVELPSKTPFTPNHLQHLSRIADAYIENVGHKGKVRIYANNQRRLDAAKRLTMRASVNINRIFHASLFALLSTDDTSTSSETKSHTYALFPFLPQRSLPWTGVSGSTFRCRKVSEWLEDKIGSNSQPPVELADGSGKLLAENGVSSTVEDVISNVLLEPSDSRLVTASIGHVLVVAKSPNERPSILPPFAGHWKYPEFMKWMEEKNADRLFVPSLPSPLHDAPPTQEKIVHQLTYRLLPKNSKLAKDVKTTETPAARAECYRAGNETSSCRK